MKTANVLPALDVGISIGSKPENIESLAEMRYQNNRWINIVESLGLIDSTKCIQIDSEGKKKNTITYYKAAIKKTACLGK